MSYAGFYINLDRSVARRAEIEGEIARFGLQPLYQRFAAADGNVMGFPNGTLSNSEIGCFTSHLLLLKRNLGCPVHLHIVEDDAVFSSFTRQALITITGEMIDEYDIIFTESLIPVGNGDYKELKALYEAGIERNAAGEITEIHPVIIKYVAGTTSYIVNRRSIAKLVEIFTQELSAGARGNVDLVIRDASDRGLIRTGCIFPFVTGIRLEGVANSTITGRKLDELTLMAVSLGRCSFFVGSDLDALNVQADRLLPLPRSDAHHRLLSRVLSFSLTEKWHPYY